MSTLSLDLLSMILTAALIAISVNWGVHFVEVLVMTALLFGVYINAPDFANLPCKITWKLMGLSKYL